MASPVTCIVTGFFCLRAPQKQVMPRMGRNLFSSTYSEIRRAGFADRTNQIFLFNSILIKSKMYCNLILINI